MNVDWNNIRFFLALSRTQSFMAAAEALQVTHSTVSRRISSMEDELQTQLVYRSERGCRLTPAGEKLLPIAEEIENSMMGIEGSISGYNSQLTGAIRIGAPDGIGNSYLAPRLGSMQKSHPSLTVELIAVPMYYSLSKREIDILITIRKPTTASIITRKLTTYRLGLFASQAYLDEAPPISRRSDLKRHKLIGYIDDLLFDKDLQFMDEILPGLEPTFRSSTVIAQLNTVAAGGGIGVIPYFMTTPEYHLVPVLPEITLERGYWLQVNPDSQHLARVRTTIDFLVDQVKNEKQLFMSCG